MTLARRGFLRILGTAPVAAKMAADAEALRLTGSGNPGLTGNRFAAPPGGEPIEEPSPRVPYEETITRASDFLRIGLVPPELLEQIRDQSRWVDRLDPDIASKVSWSLSYKFLVQRERNYERALNDMKSAAKAQRTRKLLKTLIGVNWPW
jgi:hypothetical protein